MYNANLFAERLRSVRTSQKLTQVQLAKMAEITAATISAYEKKAKNPSLENVMKISKALNVSIDWLCGASDTNNGGTIEKYSDFIKTFIEIIKPFYCSIDIEYTEFDDISKTAPIATHTNINIKSNTLAEFFADFNKMKKLFVGGTIDENIFNSWLDGQMKKYNFSIDDDDSFPF